MDRLQMTFAYRKIYFPHIVLFLWQRIFDGKKIQCISIFFKFPLFLTPNKCNFNFFNLSETRHRYYQLRFICSASPEPSEDAVMHIFWSINYVLLSKLIRTLFLFTVRAVVQGEGGNRWLAYRDPVSWKELRTNGPPGNL